MAKKSNKKNWIKGAIKNPGAFTAKAKAAKMSVAEYRNKVLANPESYPVATVQQARLAKTLSKFQPGGNPYAMPTSAATSGYTSNMSGMAGAQNAALQLQQLQQEAMDFQNRNVATDKARSEEEDAAQLQGIQQDVSQLATDKGIGAIQAARAGRLINKIGKGTASAKQVGKAAQTVADATGAGAGQTTIDMLSNYASGADAVKSGVEAGQSATAAATSGVGAGPYAAIASLAGKGVEHLSDDDDATKTNTGEGFGRGLSGVGSGVGMAAMLGLGPIGLVGAGLAGGYLALRKQRKDKLAAREEDARREREGAKLGASEQQAFLQSQLETGRDMGYNIGSSATNSYLPGYQMMEAGGSEMIKRADGSYSRRGLYDNMRANKGSGKKPTEEMLKQEKKIKAEEKKTGGGYMRPLPGGAVEFVGPKHSKGGIMIDENTEVEGGETMDKVSMKSNGGEAGDYIFSDFLKLGKKTFAQRHKEMLTRGASQADIQKLAKMQEEVAKREGRDENGPRNPDNIMQAGGGVDSGEVSTIIPSREEFMANPEKYMFDPEGAFSEEWTDDQHETAYGTFQTDDGKVIGDNEVEEAKMKNPWYGSNWDDFDPANPDDVTAYQEALNAVAGREIVKVDGKFGQQTASAYIPFKSVEVNKVAGEPAPEEAPAEEAPPAEETPESIPAVKLRNTPIMPYQLMGPIAELTSKYPQPNTIAASPTGRIKLPRVNFNSERAALSGQVSSANRYIESQAAGPGAISSKLSMLDKQRQGNIETANAEAKNNKDLMAREELANLQASQFDAGQTFGARQFNAIAQNQRDQNEYEKRMMAYNQLGTNLAQYSNDLRSYKAEERVAEASQIDSEYTRQKYLEQLRKNSKKKKSPYYGMGDAQLREAAAKMVESAPTYQMQNERRMNALLTAQQAAQGNQTNQTTTEPTTARRGGKYIKRYGKVKRKK